MITEDIWLTVRMRRLFKMEGEEKKGREEEVNQKRERQTEGEIGIVYHQRSFARQ